MTHAISATVGNKRLENKSAVKSQRQAFHRQVTKTQSRTSCLSVLVVLPILDHFAPRIVPKSPMDAAAIPPMSIQTALSVGEPVKNRETSELNDFVAFTPITMSTMPPTSRAMEMALFMTRFRRAIRAQKSQRFPSRDDSDQHHDNRDDQKNMNEAAHGGPGDDAKQPENY